MVCSSRIFLEYKGTTNFMLCKMEDEGAEYSNALQEAQSLGYAEADPTADVEGLDVQAKIALLGKFCSEPKITRFCL
jgi:homoserine dehydrogenase